MSGPSQSGPWGSAEPTPSPRTMPIPEAPHEAVTAARVNGTDFVAAQRDNRSKTWLLIVALISIGFFLGYVLGWAMQAWGTDANQFHFLAVSGLGLFGGFLLSFIGLISAGVTLTFGDKIVLSMNGAKEVTPEAEPVLHNVVEEMAIAAGLPKPKVYIMESEALNAFATGLSPQKSAIAVTRGLLNTLNREQLQGVVAHEMGHVLNLDTRYMVAVGIMVGLIALVSDVVLRSMRFGSFGRSRRNSSSSSDSKGRWRRGDHRLHHHAGVPDPGPDRGAAGAPRRLAPARIPGRCNLCTTDPQSDRADRRLAEARRRRDQGPGDRQSRDPAPVHRQPAEELRQQHPGDVRHPPVDRRPDPAAAESGEGVAG